MQSLVLLQERRQQLCGFPDECGGKFVQKCCLDDVNSHTYIAMLDCSIRCYRHPAEEVGITVDVDEKLYFSRKDSMKWYIGTCA